MRAVSQVVDLKILIGVEASLEAISTRLDRLESAIADGPSDSTATAADQDDG